MGSITVIDAIGQWRYQGTPEHGILRQRTYLQQVVEVHVIDIRTVPRSLIQSSMTSREELHVAQVVGREGRDERLHDILLLGEYRGLAIEILRLLVASLAVGLLHLTSHLHQDAFHRSYGDLRKRG